MATKSILRHGYMAAVLAELKRDAGELWVEPEIDPAFECDVPENCKVLLFTRSNQDRCFFYVICYRNGQREMQDSNDEMHDYTPARFRAALRKIRKQKGK